MNRRYESALWLRPDSGRAECQLLHYLGMDLAAGHCCRGESPSRWGRYATRFSTGHFAQRLRQISLGAMGNPGDLRD